MLLNYQSFVVGSSSQLKFDLGIFKGTHFFHRTMRNKKKPLSINMKMMSQETGIEMHKLGSEGSERKMIGWNFLPHQVVNYTKISPPSNKQTYPTISEM